MLLVQWELARRRAAIGGATMMTARWWPWFELGLVQRVSANSFRPRPSVDGGVLTVSRRAEPLVDARDRRRYQSTVHQVFTGRGNGIAQILDRQLPPRVARQWLRDNGIRACALPRDLDARQWVDLFTVTGGGLPNRPVTGG